MEQTESTGISRRRRLTIAGVSARATFARPASALRNSPGLRPGWRKPVHLDGVRVCDLLERLWALVCSTRLGVIVDSFLKLGMHFRFTQRRWSDQTIRPKAKQLDLGIGNTLVSIDLKDSAESVMGRLWTRRTNLRR